MKKSYSGTQLYETYKSGVSGLNYKNQQLPDYEQLDERAKIGWTYLASTINNPQK